MSIEVTKSWLTYAEIPLPTSSSLLTSLISYWNLDEASGTRSDSLGTNNLTDNGSTPNTTGKVGNAASFNGSSQWLSHASNASLQTGDIDFTIAVWAYITSAVTVGNIVAKRTGSATSLEYYLRYLISSDRFNFEVSPDGSTPVTTINADSFGSPSLNTWYFIACWHDSSANTINIQVNNGAVDSTSHTTGVFAGTAQFNIAASGNSGTEGDFFAGNVDEVGFWKRVLTSDERTTLYNSGSGTTYPF